MRMRRRKVLRPSRARMWQTNHPPTIPTVSALLRELVAMGNGSRRRRHVGLCPSAAQSIIFDDWHKVLEIRSVISGKTRFFKTVYGLILGHMRLHLTVHI